jgi:hypothetical protein
VFGREWTAFNGSNRYGCHPFFGFCYADVPGRFYGQSVCDVVEADQKFAEALLNARVDELNLIIHSPIIKKRGIIFPPTMQRIRPGVIWEADDPGKDIIRMEMGNVTQNAYIEYQALESRCQAKTGVTDLAVLGVPSSGGNSANRTATGVNAQSNASNSRVHYQSMMIEDQFIQPMLNVFLDLNRKFLDPNVMMEILGPDGQILKLDPVDVLNADVDFTCKSSSRMKARNFLQSGGMQLLTQYIMNPQVLEMMAEQQMKTLDIEGVSELFFDTYGLPPKSLFRVMNQQEAQERQQRMMAPLMLKQQLQGQRLQSQQQVASEKDETKLLSDLLKLIASNPGAMDELSQFITGGKGLMDFEPKAATPNGAAQ